MAEDDKTLNLDPKTAAVFKKKNYVVEKKLNEGAFGQVFKGRNVQTGELVAIKVMFIDKLGDKYNTRFWPRELAALQEVKHEHVIAVHDIIRADNKYFIFLEFANGGDITGWLKKNNGPMAESLACYWFTQVSRALQYMHDEHKMAHRDIKIDNVLLHNNRAKLTDFGFARNAYDLDRHAAILSGTFCGTQPYYSPQLVQRRRYNPFAADCWAMGVMLFAMLNNKFPFHFDNDKTMLAEQLNPDHLATRYVKKFPADLRDLQEKFFIVEEKNRITMAQVLEHPWILRKGK
ncbi:hypothetical protein RDWZM_009154 [Blomia tropicalis]|uniref:Protein kinase domain-containing protein n=1 Tax=Blomia tropicalis TaxID=40697 RepID=A0A9Q0M5U8_BLOTA|nr:protein serine threonine kinase [Blomia tropicalis]KAJ6217997.1 hypothetical protein RDWZM_009154 [Blomia tropicalis]